LAAEHETASKRRGHYLGGNLGWSKRAEVLRDIERCSIGDDGGSGGSVSDQVTSVPTSSVSKQVGEYPRESKKHVGKKWRGESMCVIYIVG